MCHLTDSFNLFLPARRVFMATMWLLIAGRPSIYGLRPPATGGRASAATCRVTQVPMRVPGGRDVRQAPAIGSHRARDVDLCV